MRTLKQVKLKYGFPTNLLVFTPIAGGRAFTATSFSFQVYQTQSPLFQKQYLIAATEAAIAPDAAQSTAPTMELSAKVEYAFLSLLEMASRRSRTPLKINHIATRQAIPERYLEHILVSLRRKGIVESQRGVSGGYRLACNPKELTLLEILLLIEENKRPPEAEQLAASTTLEKDVVREMWKEVKTASDSILNQYTLQDLCQKCEASRKTALTYQI